MTSETTPFSIYMVLRVRLRGNIFIFFYKIYDISQITIIDCHRLNRVKLVSTSSTVASSCECASNFFFRKSKNVHISLKLKRGFKRTTNKVPITVERAVFKKIKKCNLQHFQKYNTGTNIIHINDE